MKNKNILLLALVFIISGVLFSCDDDDEGGTPFINYIRVTDPVSSDSLLVSAGQGQMVAIIGDNLGQTTELWFNDQRAELNTTFVTDRSIITRVPTEIPEEVTDEMRLVFKNGQTLIYNFNVDISAPQITRMRSEYVPEGETASIFGNFFYEPIQVTFTGGVQGEVVMVEDQAIEVIVPAGAEPGPVTVTSNFGSTESDLWFRDNRNILAKQFARQLT